MCRTFKRKNNSIETKAEPTKKALKKTEIIIEHKTLQEKYKVLEEKHNLLLKENVKHNESIQILEETVNIFERKINSAMIEHKSVTVQTKIMRCEDCEFQADCLIDLVDHMHEFHAVETPD